MPSERLLARPLDALAKLVAGLLLVAAPSACSTEEETDAISTAVPTSVSVTPDLFLGDLECQLGGAQSYVATLAEVPPPPDGGDPEGDLSGAIATLPSSPPTPCSQSVFFRQVGIDRAYRAEIDVDDQLAGELEPVGGTSSGSRVMLRRGGVDPTDRVTPRRTVRCGTAVSPRADESVPVSGCTTIWTAPTPAATAIEVNPRTTLGMLRCAASGGSVLTFDVLPESAALTPQGNIACDATQLVARYEQGLVPGTLYRFTVRAEVEGATTPYTADCVATAKEGLTTFAECAPLVPTP